MYMVNKSFLWVVVFLCLVSAAFGSDWTYSQVGMNLYLLEGNYSFVAPYLYSDSFYVYFNESALDDSVDVRIADLGLNSSWNESRSRELHYLKEEVSALLVGNQSEAQTWIDDNVTKLEGAIASNNLTGINVVDMVGNYSGWDNYSNNSKYWYGHDSISGFYLLNESSENLTGSDVVGLVGNYSGWDNYSNNTKYWYGYSSISDFNLLNQSSENLTEADIFTMGFTKAGADNTTWNESKSLVLHYLKSAVIALILGNRTEIDALIVGNQSETSGWIDDNVTKLEGAIASNNLTDTNIGDFGYIKVGGDNTTWNESKSVDLHYLKSAVIALILGNKSETSTWIDNNVTKLEGAVASNNLTGTDVISMVGNFSAWDNYSNNTNFWDGHDSISAFYLLNESSENLTQ